MLRALILGCPGSGKSFFARRLAAITGLPLYYLDQIWHRADRTTISRGEFDSRLAAILAPSRWIIDGNYQRTLPMRLAHCDSVFLFDLPLADCVAGAQGRIGQKRPDLPWVETEFDPDFRQWIIDFRTNELPAIMELLAKADCARVIFKSRLEADAWLRDMAMRQSQARTGKPAPPDYFADCQDRHGQ